MKLPERIRQHLWLVFVIALLFLGVALLAWRLAPESVSVPTAAEKLVLGVSDSFLTIPVIVAEEMDFLRAAGLDVAVRRYPSGKAVLEALLRGEVEVATVAETPIAIASLQRRDFVVVGSYVTHRGFSGQHREVLVRLLRTWLCCAPVSPRETVRGQGGWPIR